MIQLHITSFTGNSKITSNKFHYFVFTNPNQIQSNQN